MHLTVSNLSTLSRLLDEALDLEPAQIKPWLAAVPAQHMHLVPRLAAMLDEYLCPSDPQFLADGPTLSAAAAAEISARHGVVVGPYRLVRELGRGGMSVVWLAVRLDGSVKRKVALKMPLLAMTTAAQVERFERERDVLALLNHAQIAQLYDAGIALSGQPYLVMEQVEGLPITEACNAANMCVAERLQIFQQVLAAVAHAHKHLVVHRDIKPSNVFVDHRNQVKLLDFGIAKLLQTRSDPSAASTLTLDGGCAMTPRYAAPEQMNGGPISTATDIYSLGVLLCELLCGAPPFVDAQRSVAATMQAVLHAPPIAPSQTSINDTTAAQRGLATAGRLRALLAGDLDTIVQKALRKTPSERYSSAEHFADDIQRYLEHSPIAARAPSLARRLQLLVQRHRHASVAAALGAVAALGLVAMLGVQYARTTVQEGRANAVREFMLDMVESAEADESQPRAEVTGRQMVEAGFKRAHERFSGQPQLLGEVLSELGRMFDRFGDETKAQASIIEADALLAVNAPADDPALNKNRVLLATSALATGDVMRAQTLATTARDACTRGDAECAKARAYATSLLASVASRQGRWQESLVLMRQMVVEMERGFGKGHAVTARAWRDLAVIARDAGHLQEAERAIGHALEVANHTVLVVRERGLLLRTQAVIDIDLGHYAAARASLQNQAARTAEPNERAAQLRLLANAEVALGEGAAAQQTARQALALAKPGSRVPEVWYAHQAHARATSLLGDQVAALAEMQSVLQGLAAAGYTAGSVPILRAQRFVAEMMLRQGDLDAAWAQSGVVVEKLSAQSGNTAIELGQALALQSRIEEQRGNASQAERLQARALELLRQQLPADHPLLARAPTAKAVL